MKENKKMLNLEELENVFGGAIIPHDQIDAFHEEIMKKYASYMHIYDCPNCHGYHCWNLDPGIFRQMRVLCRECGFWGTWTGGED